MLTLNNEEDIADCPQTFQEMSIETHASLVKYVINVKNLNSWLKENRFNWNMLKNKINLVLV